MKPQMFSPMLAKSYTDFADRIKYPIAIQPKIDGIRAISTYDGLYTRNKKRIISVPKINPLVTPHKNLDGELYTNSMPFEELSGVVRRYKNVHPLNYKVDYYVFDYCCDKPFLERYEIAKQIVNNIDSPKVRIVETHIARRFEEVMMKFDFYINLGYEGIMLRALDKPYEQKRTAQLLKMKPWKYMTVTIRGFEEGTGKYTNNLGALVCKTDLGRYVNVGSGLSDELRSDIWESQFLYEGEDITIKYQELSQTGVPRFPTLYSMAPRQKGSNVL